MRILLLFLLSAYSFLSPVGSYAQSNKIWLTVGLVTAETGPTPFCTGILIDKELVLTAGHCAQSLLKSEFSWVLFGNEATFSPDSSRILNIAIHPSYTPTGFNPIGGYKILLGATNDLALLKIVPARERYAKLLPVQFSHENLANGTPLIGSGWGVKSTGNQDFGVFPAIFKTPLMPTSKNFDAVFTGTAHACNGDSGGPIFSRVGSELELAGIISASGIKTLGDCNSKTSVTAINLINYTDWLSCERRALLQGTSEICK
jgi:secreted trypsin-like serine protease